MNDTFPIAKAGLASLVCETIVVDPHMGVRAVQALLQDKSPLECVVVATNDKPLGLVMRCHLDRVLGTQFGRSLYLHRPIAEIMDAQALVVDIGASMEETARRAMARGDTHLYDDLIVTDKGRLRGTVSVPHLLTEMSRAQGVLQLAGGAAHELNQPLQIVLGYLELLSRDSANVDWVKTVEMIRTGAERIAQITRRLQELISGWQTVSYLDNMNVVDLGGPSAEKEEDGRP